MRAGQQLAFAKVLNGRLSAPSACTSTLGVDTIVAVAARSPLPSDSWCWGSYLVDITWNGMSTGTARRHGRGPAAGCARGYSRTIIHMIVRVRLIDASFNFDAWLAVGNLEPGSLSRGPLRQPRSCAAHVTLANDTARRC